MFKLAHNGNVLLDTNQFTPANTAFVIEAIEQSPFSECKINYDAINNYFNSANPERILVVATRFDASLKIEISDDKMLATGILTLAQGGDCLSLDEAKKQLVKARVARGYKQALLEKLLQKQFELPPGSIISAPLAKGRLPVDGQPTKFKTMVATLKDHLKKPKLKEDGSVDMRDFGKLASVQPGALLIKQQPATPGQEGYTVLGDTLAANPGENHALVAGEGTEISKTNPMELLANIAGVPVEINNGMRVDDIFTVNDVSVKTGHIDFEGSVVVSSNIEPGMRVNATGDITVLGVVESGELTAGGNISVRQGLIGHQRAEDKSLSCRLSCKGDVHASHSQYCYIEANNILLDRQAGHCSMKAKNTIQIGQSELPNGKLFGGEVLDATKLIAGKIGNESGAKMTINLASSAVDMTRDIDKLFSKLSDTNEQVDSLQAALEKANLIKDIDKKKQLINKIGATQLHYSQQAEQLETRLTSLEEELNNLLNQTSLTVNTILHSGVEIHMFNKVFKTTRDFPPSTAKLENNKIELEFKTQ